MEVRGGRKWRGMEESMEKGKREGEKEIGILGRERGKGCREERKGSKGQWKEGRKRGKRML